MNHSKMANSSSVELQSVNGAMARTLVPAMVYLAVLIVLGLIGNLLVIYVFTFKTKASVQHFYFVALAIFDLICCLVSMPSEIADMALYVKFESVIGCKIIRFFVVFTTLNSSITLVAIAIDRYRKICRPTNKQVTIKIARQTLVLIIGGALLFSWPAPFLYGISTVDTGTPGVQGYDCTFADDIKNTRIPLIYNTALFFGFVVEVLVMVVLYSLILAELRRHSQYIRKVMKRSARVTDPKSKDGNDNSIYSITSEANDSMLFSHDNRRKETISTEPILPKAETDATITLSCCLAASGVDDKETAKGLLTLEKVNMSVFAPLTKLEGNFPSQSSTTTNSDFTSTSANETIKLTPSLDKTPTNDLIPPRLKVKKPKQGKRKSDHKTIATKTTLIAFLVTVAFILSYLPHLCLQVAKLIYHFDDRKGPIVLYNIVIRSFFINSVCNPFIYAALNLTFRAEVKILLRNCFRRS